MVIRCKNILYYIFLLGLLLNCSYPDNKIMSNDHKLVDYPLSIGIDTPRKVDIGEVARCNIIFYNQGENIIRIPLKSIVIEIQDITKLPGQESGEEKKEKIHHICYSKIPYYYTEYLDKIALSSHKPQENMGSIKNLFGEPIAELQPGAYLDLPAGFMPWAQGIYTYKVKIKNTKHMMAVQREDWVGKRYPISEKIRIEKGKELEGPIMHLKKLIKAVKKQKKSKIKELPQLSEAIAELDSIIEHFSEIDILIQEIKKHKGNTVEVTKLTGGYARLKKITYSKFSKLFRTLYKIKTATKMIDKINSEGNDTALIDSIKKRKTPYDVLEKLDVYIDAFREMIDAFPDNPHPDYPLMGTKYEKIPIENCWVGEYVSTSVRQFVSNTPSARIRKKLKHLREKVEGQAGILSVFPPGPPGMEFEERFKGSTITAEEIYTPEFPIYLQRIQALREIVLMRHVYAAKTLEELINNYKPIVDKWDVYVYNELFKALYEMFYCGTGYTALDTICRKKIDEDNYVARDLKKQMLETVVKKGILTYNGLIIHKFTEEEKQKAKDALNVMLNKEGDTAR